jgi:predicted dehydrogenase
MVAAADAAKVTLMVAQSRRHIRALYMAWERIDEIGKPLSAVYLSLMRESGLSEWSKSKAKSGHLVYTSLGSHTIDYLLWLFKGKKKPVRVYSEGCSNIPGVEGMDEASVVIGFADGALATTTLSMNNRTPRIERVVIIGSQGAMHMEHAYLRSPEAAYVGGAMSKLLFNEQVLWEGVQEVGNFTLQMKEFVTAIREGRPPLSDGRDVRHVMNIIEAADLSAERHEVVWL